MTDVELREFINSMSLEEYRHFRSSLSEKDQQRFTLPFTDLPTDSQKYVIEKMLAGEIGTKILDIKTYQNDYPKRLALFLGSYRESNERGFIKDELKRVRKLEPEHRQEDINRDNIISFLEEKIEHQKGKKLGEKKLGFRLTKNGQDIRKAVEKLRDEKLVYQSTSKFLLEKILYSKDEINKKINWTGTISSLNYFINNVAPIHSLRWKAGENCFLVKGEFCAADTLRNTRDVSKKDKAIINEVLLALAITTHTTHI